MKITIRKSIHAFIFSVLLLAVQISISHAHDMWINMQDYELDLSKPAVLTLGWGHQFVVPGKDVMSRDRVEKVFFIGPDANETAIPQGDNAYQSPTPLKKGSWVAVAIPQNGFSSKTTEGYQRGKSKKDIKDVIECSFSEKYAKALFAVGSPGGEAFSQVLGHKLEIVPMKDPSTLKEGDDLPVKVLLEGKPARNYVYGTYAGFSSEPSTFAYTTYTDKDGIAKIKMIKTGIWLLIVKHETPYPDLAVCDKQTYTAVLTFQIK